MNFVKFNPCNPPAKYAFDCMHGKLDGDVHEHT